MLLRMRWFTFGVLASLGVVAYAANQLRRMRERFTAENLARSTARGVASGLDSLADKVSPRHPVS